jgi:predicted Zn-dependent peptidase
MSWRRSFGVLVLLACGGGAPTPLPQVPGTPLSGLAQWGGPPPVAPEPDLTLPMAVRRVTFDSGVSLTVVMNEGSHTAALQLWVPSAGDRSQGPVAMMANALRAGTRVDEKTVLVNPQLAYEAIGIDTQASGSTFSWQVLERATEQALRLFGQFVFHPAFERQATEEQLHASLTFIQASSGGPAHLANIARGALPGLAVPSPEQDARGLFKLNPRELSRIHRCVMLPAGAELVVTSSLPFERVEPWARAAFGGLTAPTRDPSCGAFDIAPIDPATARTDRIELGIVYGGAFDPIVMMSLPGPAPRSAEYLPFALLGEVLEARDAGSAQELRHMGATYGIHFNLNESFPGVTVLDVQGQIEEDNVQRAVRQVIEDIRGLADSLTPEQLDEVKRRWRNRYIGGLASNGSVSSKALSQIRHGLPPESLTSLPNEVMQVSIERCRDTARQWLSDAQPSIAVAGLPGKLVRGLNLSAHTRAMRWTYELQEQRKR